MSDSDSSIVVVPKMSKQSFGVSATSTKVTAPQEHNQQDPYSYQLGFGNYFSSEAVPGALPPPGRNVPQKCPYDLYSEQMNGSPFASSRDNLQHNWMYRVRPSVAHSRPRPMAPKPDLESCFSPANPNVKWTPLTYEWAPLEDQEPHESVNFLHSLKTMGGCGDSTMGEGVAMHMYSCNASMTNEAFCNNDGDFLILPVKGRLDIQTELGKLMVRPGELCVVQAGVKWNVSLPDGQSSGYVHEIFGTHFELPDLGVIGSNGLAAPRDFQFPVAYFDLDQSSWEVTCKLAGELFTYKQKHNPFDVVAWHGNCVPYKYAMENFTPLSCGIKEQCDPTIYTVLLAKSKRTGVSISEFAVFTPKYITALDTYRPPYYHRNRGTEVLGMIYGEYHGSVRDVQAGCLSVENSYMPHGDSYKAWKRATERDLEPELQSEGSMSFMLHMNSGFGFTKFALERHPGMKRIEGYEGAFWDDLQGDFLNHLPLVNEKLKAAGLPVIPVADEV